MSQFVFGYASLAGRSGALAELEGYRRVWSVAMDNSRDLPGYKYYVDAGTGERPAAAVTFIDLEADPKASVNGVVFRVTDTELAALDARERNYSRREVSDLLTTRLDGPAWAYFGTAEARHRHESALANGTAVVSRAYRDLVLAGFARLGPDQSRRFAESTSDPGVPLRDLDRIELPPA